MNARSQVFEFSLELCQVEEVVCSLLHTLLFHRSTGNLYLYYDLILLSWFFHFGFNGFKGIVFYGTIRIFHVLGHPSKTILSQYSSDMIAYP